VRQIITSLSSSGTPALRSRSCSKLRTRPITKPTLSARRDRVQKMPAGSNSALYGPATPREKQSPALRVRGLCRSICAGVPRDRGTCLQRAPRAAAFPRLVSEAERVGLGVERLLTGG
jgi:hypothetical protein